VRGRKQEQKEVEKLFMVLGNGKESTFNCIIFGIIHLMATQPLAVLNMIMIILEVNSGYYCQLSLSMFPARGSTCALPALLDFDATCRVLLRYV